MFFYKFFQKTFVFWTSLSLTLLGCNQIIAELNYDENSEVFNKTKENNELFNSEYRDNNKIQAKIGSIQNNIQNNAWNNKYNSLFQDSLVINFYNQSLKDNSKSLSGGTIWILDYALTYDNSYPTTWYYATNAHVAINLENPLSYLPYVNLNPEKRTEKIQLLQYSANHNKSNDTWFMNKPSKEEILELSIEKVKHIHMGIDFLKSSPYQFSEYYHKGVEEIIDFAVLEITFPNSMQAKKFTNEYANKKPINKFLQQSLLSQYQSSKYYLAGFPMTDVNNPLETDDSIDELVSKITPTINTKQIDAHDTNALGSNLSNINYFHPFYKKGVIDMFTSFHEVSLNIWGKEYYLAGLGYVLTNGRLGPGSSGSKIVNDNNEIVSIHSLETSDSNIGFSFALKSEHFKVNNVLLNNYYLPEYDIIYGGGKDQNNSYFQDLKFIKKRQNIPNFRTSLFPKGF